MKNHFGKIHTRRTFLEMGGGVVGVCASINIARARSLGARTQPILFNEEKLGYSKRNRAGGAEEKEKKVPF